MNIGKKGIAIILGILILLMGTVFSAIPLKETQYVVQEEKSRQVPYYETVEKTRDVAYQELVTKTRQVPYLAWETRQRTVPYEEAQYKKTYTIVLWTTGSKYTLYGVNDYSYGFDYWNLFYGKLYTWKIYQNSWETYRYVYDWSVTTYKTFSHYVTKYQTVTYQEEVTKYRTESYQEYETKYKTEYYTENELRYKTENYKVNVTKTKLVRWWE